MVGLRQLWTMIANATEYDKAREELRALEQRLEEILGVPGSLGTY